MESQIYFSFFYICIKAKFLVAVQEQQVCPFFVGLFLLFVFFRLFMVRRSLVSWFIDIAVLPASTLALATHFFQVREFFSRSLTLVAVVFLCLLTFYLLCPN